MTYELTDHFVVAASPEETWRFFSAAENLPAITPPWLRFTVHTPMTVAMACDTRLDYTIRWMGVPVKWRTRITEWSPPGRFIDEQERGPYALWRHEHTFEPVEGGGTSCRDHVTYRLPFGPLGRIVHAAMVKRQLETIFQFRRRVIAERLGWVRAIQEDVAIARR